MEWSVQKDLKVTLAAEFFFFSPEPKCSFIETFKKVEISAACLCILRLFRASYTLHLVDTYIFVN